VASVLCSVSRISLISLRVEAPAALRVSMRCGSYRTGLSQPVAAVEVPLDLAYRLR
jgi:hypothetical protein